MVACTSIFCSSARHPLRSVPSCCSRIVSVGPTGWAAGPLLSATRVVSIPRRFALPPKRLNSVNKQGSRIRNSFWKLSLSQPYRNGLYCVDEDFRPRLISFPFILTLFFPQTFLRRRVLTAQLVCDLIQGLVDSPKSFPLNQVERFLLYLYLHFFLFFSFLLLRFYPFLPLLNSVRRLWPTPFPDWMTLIQSVLVHVFILLIIIHVLLRHLFPSPSPTLSLRSIEVRDC